MIFVWVLSVVLAVIILAVTVTYNQFIKLQNLIKEAWSGIDVQLKRRHDLIPQLVEAVRAYAGHEKNLFENVTKTRSSAIAAGSSDEKTGAENALSGGLRKLFAVAEAYPQLKASENYLELQKSLVTVEDELQLARRYYNGTVRDWNVALQTFPSSLVGGLFKFRPAVFFEIETATQRENPSAKV